MLSKHLDGRLGMIQNPILKINVEVGLLTLKIDIFKLFFPQTLLREFSELSKNYIP